MVGEISPQGSPDGGSEATFRKRLFSLRLLATLIVPNIRTYLIWGEVQYAHNPTFGYVLTARAQSHRFESVSERKGFSNSLG